MLNDPTLETLQVFYGDMNQHKAQVYARLSLDDPPPNLHLSGSIRGPNSSLTRTLPVSVKMSDVGSEPTLLAHAVVPDPCFWGPTTPYLYDVNVQLSRDGRVVDSTSRWLGLRMMQVVQDRLTLEGQPWAVQGLWFRESRQPSLEPWRDAAGVAVVNHPSDQLCQAASEMGVPILAWIDHDLDQLAQQLSRLTCWPAVCMVVLPADCQVRPSLRKMAANLLFAQYLPEMHGDQVSSWADLVVVDADQHGQPPEAAAKHGLPILARVACNDQQRSPDELFDFCRQLQPPALADSALAGHLLGDFEPAT